MKRRREILEESEIRSVIEELVSSVVIKVKPTVVVVEAGDTTNQLIHTAAAAATTVVVVDIHDDAAAAHIHHDASCSASSHIPTKPFLSVCNLLLQVLDKIGPTMAVLRQDIHQNIKRLEVLHDSDPSIYSNLVEMLKKEKVEGSARKNASCSRACVWLTRSMDLAVALLQKLAKDPAKSMEQAVEESYNTTLKPWHGWISSAAYKVALKLVPDKKTFITLLIAKDESYDTLKEDLQTLVSLLVPFVEEIFSILRLYGLDNVKAT